MSAIDTSMKLNVLLENKAWALEVQQELLDKLPDDAFDIKLVNADELEVKHPLLSKAIKIKLRPVPSGETVQSSMKEPVYVVDGQTTTFYGVLFDLSKAHKPYIYMEHLKSILPTGFTMTAGNLESEYRKADENHGFIIKLPSGEPIIYCATGRASANPGSSNMSTIDACLMSDEQLMKGTYVMLSGDGRDHLKLYIEAVMLYRRLTRLYEGRFRVSPPTNAQGVSNRAFDMSIVAPKSGSMIYSKALTLRLSENSAELSINQGLSKKKRVGSTTNREKIFDLIEKGIEALNKE